MKKLWMVVIAFLFSSFMFGAVAGNGTVTGPTVGLTGDNFYLNSLTWTFSNTGNTMDAGQVFCEIPAGWTVAPERVTVVVNEGTVTKIGDLLYWGTNPAPGEFHNYIGVSLKAAVNQSVKIIFQNLTMTATAGSQTITWYQADTSTARSIKTSSVIASQPTMTIYDSNNPLVQMTVLPTPQILTTDTNFLRYQAKFSAPCKNGQIVVKWDRGTAGYQTTPNPVTWVAASGNGSVTNEIYALSTPGVIGTPTVNATQAIFPILTAGINTVFEIRVGGTPVAGTGFQGSNYVKNLSLQIRANAIFAAATQTPFVAATAERSKQFFTAMVPTSTVVMTPVAVNGKEITYQVSKVNEMQSGFLIDNNTVVYNVTSGSSVFSYTAGVGAHSVSFVALYYDKLNDNALRSVTNTATHYFNTIGNFKGQESLVQLNNYGFLTKELWPAVSIGAGYIGVTKYAEDRLMFPVTIDGAGTAQYRLDFDSNSMVASATGVTSAIGSNVATGTIYLSPIGGAYYLPAGTWQKISCTVGTAGVKDVLFNSCKVSDWKMIEK